MINEFEKYRTEVYKLIQKCIDAIELEAKDRVWKAFVLGDVDGQTEATEVLRRRAREALNLKVLKSDIYALRAWDPDDGMTFHFDKVEQVTKIMRLWVLSAIPFQYSIPTATSPHYKLFAPTPFTGTAVIALVKAKLPCPLLTAGRPKE